MNNSRNENKWVNSKDPYTLYPIPYALSPHNRLFLCLCLLLFVSGCSSTLQSGWSDFNAYFNTYYNAKTSFDRGIHQIESQRENINPERPIRIHQIPVQAGRQDFEKAIEKSADILRFHPTSRYVDNAIEIIGQSYFYQGQYFSASQKFLELYSTSPSNTKKQQAIYWRGRSLLELESYNEGLTYLKAQLYSSDYDWDREIEAEIKLVIGQLHVYNREWEDAELYISEAKQEVRNRKLLARAHFLHGQVLEKLGRYDDAFESYDLATHRANPEFSVTFNAKRKKAQVARKMEEYQWSYDFFVSMTRDDKYFEFLGDLLYEVARTLHESGDYKGAQEEYTYLLRQNLSTPSRETTAKTFYGLAEIHKNYYNDYQKAAAYYDSSAQQATDLTRLPEEFDARLMATSYGNYTDLVNRAQRLDSLLWLGSLPEAEFDSVIASITQEKIREMEQRMEQQQRADDFFVAGDDLDITDAATDTENGFLNHRNPQIMNQVSLTFRAYWGNRPLVDDWRRAEAVRLAVINRNNSRNGDREGSDMSDEETEEMLEMQNTPANQVVVDISDIPFTGEERAESKEQIASTYYEIGNVFFLTLNIPDSAKNRYHKVLERFPDSKLAPQALYSLSETYRSVDDSVKAREIADDLVEKYPRSNFAQRIAERHGIVLDYDPGETVLTRQDSLNQKYRELVDDLDNGNVRENAEKLKNFAHAYRDSDKASQALFRAATDYLTLARKDSSYQKRFDEINRINKRWELKQLEFNELKQTSYEMLEDTTLTGEEYQQWRSLSDSTLAPPDLSDYFLYEGAYWDSARVVLADISENFPGFSAIRRVERLREEIREPDKAIAGNLGEGLFSCDQLDARPEMTGEIQQFLTDSGVQEQVNSMMISMTLTLTITFDETGEPVEVRPAEEAEHQGLIENLIEALHSNVSFSSPTVNGEPVKAVCEIHIPVEFQ